MDFGLALHNLKLGHKVAREGWNGKGMSLILYAPVGQMFMGGKLLPHIMLKTVQGDYVPWLASQTDILATDWKVAEYLAISDK